jgi:6-pyruvoyl-tetrahydropterin synthase
MPIDWSGGMTALTGVGGIICAAHRDASGRLHGHTYEVTAWFPAGADALALQASLTRVVGLFDHDELLHELASGEGLCAAIAEQLPDAVQIDVSRHAERLFARWHRPDAPTPPVSKDHP